MSTKIYDAYKINCSNDINTIMGIVNEIRAKAQKAFIKDVTEVLATRYWHHRDTVKYFGEEILTSGKITDEWELRSLRDVMRKPDDARYAMFCDESSLKHIAKDLPYTRLEAKLMIIPCDDMVLAMFFGDYRYQTYITRHPLFEDFHYQDQTDRPDNISKKKWKIREEIWDKAIGPDYIPKNHGFLVDIVSYDDVSLMCQVLCNRNKFNAAARKAKTDFKDRLSYMRDMIDCPLIPKDASCSDFFRIRDTEEYKEWARKTDDDLREKLGIPKEESNGTS